MRKNFGDYDSALLLLANYFKGKKPLGLVFNTEKIYYLYDSGTNKILRCDFLTYGLLENLFYKDFEYAVRTFLKENGEDNFLKTVAMLKKSIENQNIFGLYEVTNSALFIDKKELKEMISAKSSELLLEVTEACNLHCRYCVYNGINEENRNHDKGNMNVNTAYAAIDFLKKNSKKSNKISIGFYGGEPFINFLVIKKSTEYGKKIFLDKKIEFSVTTNGTLITPEISRFLYENNFNVTVSIDGQEDSHDKYRKNKSGKGSFKNALMGLRNLFKEYGNQFKDKISLYSVYAPPFSADQINSRANLWKESSWLPYDMRANIVYYSGPRLPNISHKEDKDLFQWAFENYIESKKEEILPHPYAISMIEKLLTFFSQRPVYNRATDKLPLHGCCVPGHRRIFVTVSGDFRICEKISNSSPIIGNVKTGIYFDVLNNDYLTKYRDMSIDICKKCWAINICESCFIDGFDEKGLSYDKKTERCKEKRLSIAKKMYYFCKTIEIYSGIPGYISVQVSKGEIYEEKSRTGRNGISRRWVES